MVSTVFLIFAQNGGFSKVCSTWGAAKLANTTDVPVQLASRSGVSGSELDGATLPTKEKLKKTQAVKLGLAVV